MAFWCTYLSCKWTRDYCWVKNTFITSYSSYYAAQNKWEEIFWLSNFQREKSHSFHTKTLLDDWHLEHFQCLDEQDTPPNWIIATNNEQDWKISGSLVPETTSWCTVSTYRTLVEFICGVCGGVRSYDFLKNVDVFSSLRTCEPLRDFWLEFTTVDNVQRELKQNKDDR